MEKKLKIVMILLGISSVIMMCVVYYILHYKRGMYNTGITNYLFIIAIGMFISSLKRFKKGKSEIIVKCLMYLCCLLYLIYLLVR